MVEHDLAKVGVEGSSPFARSKNFLKSQRLIPRCDFHSAARSGTKRKFAVCAGCATRPDWSRLVATSLAATLFQMIVIEIHAGLELPNFDAP